MFSIMMQWDRNGWGGNFTASNGENNNDTIWNYYGHDYYDYAVNSVGTADDMRLVWVRDGDQSQAKYNAPHGKQDDYGDPHPITGELMSARDAGLLTLHWDTDVDDPRDDPAQPLQIGWVNYNHNTRTGVEGHEAKYNQIRYGLQQDGTYHPGPEHPTPGRPVHPNGGAWIRPSNDPAVSSTYWPGKVLGVDWEVTDVEQNFGFGPFTLDPNEALHGLFVVGAGGVDVERCRDVGARWLAGELTDAQKNEVVFSARDSLFRNMRTAKAIYEAKTFPTGQGGMRYASTRSEFEEALQAAVAAGTLSLSPPAPATFDVRSGPDQGELSWTVNTGVNTTYTGFRLYRALAGYKGRLDVYSHLRWYRNLVHRPGRQARLLVLLLPDDLRRSGQRIDSVDPYDSADDSVRRPGEHPLGGDSCGPEPVVRVGHVAAVRRPHGQRGAGFPQWLLANPVREPARSVHHQDLHGRRRSREDHRS